MVFQNSGFMKYYASEKWAILEEAFKGLKKEWQVAPQELMYSSCTTD